MYKLALRYRRIRAVEGRIVFQLSDWPGVVLEPQAVRSQIRSNDIVHGQTLQYSRH